MVGEGRARRFLLGLTAAGCLALIAAQFFMVRENGRVDLEGALPLQTSHHAVRAQLIIGVRGNQTGKLAKAESESGTPLRITQDTAPLAASDALNSAQRPFRDSLQGSTRSGEPESGAVPARAPANFTARPRRKPSARDLDWLHVPKTGTSLMLSLLLTKCDKELHQQSGGDKAKEAKLLNDLYVAVRDYHDNESCTRNLHFYHRPLKKKVDYGHRDSSSDTVENVVTILRDPVDRIASGFVHKKHDCESLSGPSTEEVCNAILSAEEGGVEGFELTIKPTISREAAMAHVEEYAYCVEGCAARMASGLACSHLKKKLDGNDTVVLKRSLSKIKRFAYVGVMERWEESMCLWKNMFPRGGGREFPTAEINKNVRPSRNHICVNAIVKHLRTTGFRDMLDDALYEAAKERFEADLAAYPSCIAPRANEAGA
mmetsp:Transcript_18149/g.52104  ORF Transcript_18149/g.52104 Transcript_18149/m.52104 type:complete len:430 (+) Transcript_18149:3542-4831(+)